MIKTYWCSWWSRNNISYPQIPLVDGVSPIWYTGQRSIGENFTEDETSFVAVIRAETELQARKIIEASDFSLVQINFVSEMDTSEPYISTRYPWPVK